MVNRRVDNVDVMDENETNRLRASLEDFLVTLGTYAPEHFLFTVVNEATSYKWVLDKIKTTFRLDTRGASFLAADYMNLNFGQDRITYQQGYQAVK